jgi:hypothetical protein|tara:strand:- start:1017 stop:1154 length:138 start_codon:yes stop_codon:yes gene_type:complete
MKIVIELHDAETEEVVTLMHRVIEAVDRLEKHVEGIEEEADASPN